MAKKNDNKERWSLPQCACAMSVVELHKAYTKAYNACNKDTMKFWSNMIALRASQQL